MRNHSAMLMLAATLVAAPGPLIHAQMVTADDARRAAENWITLVVRQDGSWGGAADARVGTTTEFARGKRVLGYLCSVKPKGYVLVPLRKEFAPVKAYSTDSVLDPVAEGGMTDLLKSRLALILDAVEREVGPIQSATEDQVLRLVSADYRDTWRTLIVEPQVFASDQVVATMQSNYQSGTVLLTSKWDQCPPYNDDCPSMGCSWPQYNNYNNRAWAGCVATAAAQIMRHWCWPPYPDDGDYYDWPSMRDLYEWDIFAAGFVDELGRLVTQAEVDAVARLSHEIGVKVGMVYGCGGSSASLGFIPGCMREAYVDHFHFRGGDGGAKDEWRGNWSDDDWWSVIQDDLDRNRPIQYGFTSGPPTFEVSHSVAVDGWKTIALVRYVHVNYGWGDHSNTAWYELDDKLVDDSGGRLFEMMVRRLVPAVALGSSVSGTYSTNASFRYRYVDQDATGESATFRGEQRIQFLPGTRLRCLTSGSGSIRFEGASSPGSSLSLQTRLYARGDLSRGMHIYTGAALRLRDGGCIRLR